MNSEFFILLFFIPFVCGLSADEIRKPAVAGMFYPADKKELSSMVDGFLKSAVEKDMKGDIVGLISPHAGYVYSGSIAAQAYKQLKGRRYETVIIIGGSHRVYLNSPSIYAAGEFRTPLGDVDIDTELAAKLMENYKEMQFNPQAQEQEHSIEVQIPFLQKVLKNFKIVPILLGNDANAPYRLAAAIKKSIGAKKVLVVASTDMSHYPEYEDAVSVDNRTIGLIKGFEFDKLLHQEIDIKNSNVNNLACYLCGIMPVLSLLAYAKSEGAVKADLLQYKNSGDSSFGKKNEVVGYCAIVFSK